MGLYGHVHISTHCTGGCPFNIGLNWSLGNKTREKIMRRWTMHAAMWTGVKRLAKRSRELKGTMSIEWPHIRVYHRLAQTRKFMDEYDMVYRKVYGCMLGLRSSETRTLGKLLGKAWGR